jgi:hypothetical protein
MLVLMRVNESPASSLETRVRPGFMVYMGRRCHMKIYKQLKSGQIEITWMKGDVETLQTNGQVFNGSALVLDLGDSKLIIPLTSVRHFRVPSVS